MPRQTVLALLRTDARKIMRAHIVCALLAILLLAAGPADAGMPFFGRRDKAKGGMFPDDGDVPELNRTGKILTYKDKDFQDLYGAAGNRYIQFGLVSMTSADYTYGAPNSRVSIEIANMENPTAAAGLFHHHRGKVLQGNGKVVEVGAEGVLDSGRGGRNLYFYRSSMFVKIVYSGKDPVPSLMPIATYIDARLPGGRDEKPEGFALIDIEGVNKDTIALTPGFAFNLSFLPAAVWASAPGGGSPASDMFIITRRTPTDASTLYKDYLAYLRLHAEYVEEYSRGKAKYTKAVDPNQGRVLFTAHKNIFIIAARPDGYDKGEVLIDRVVQRIDGDADDAAKPKRRGLFRRSKE